MSARHAFALAFTFALGASAFAQSSPVPGGTREFGAQEVPRLPSAARQYAHARALKGRRVGASSSMKAVWAERAIAAYRAVRELHPEVPSLGAEAAFRAGMLLVATDRSELGLAEFGHAIALGDGTEFVARARLEIGHVHRRAERYTAALDAYLALAFSGASPRDCCDDAWLFAGDVWNASGEATNAVRAWRNVAHGARDPCARVAAFDRLAKKQLAIDDLDGAAELLNECIRSVGEAALERTEQGDRARRALANMHVVDELPRRIAARWHATRGKIGEEKALTTLFRVSPHAR